MDPPAPTPARGMTTKAQRAATARAAARAERQTNDLAAIAAAPNLEAAIAAALTAYHRNAPTAPVGGGFLSPTRAREAAAFVYAALEAAEWTTAP